jgi:hypothetical protein
VSKFKQLAYFGGKGHMEGKTKRVLAIVGAFIIGFCSGGASVFWGMRSYLGQIDALHAASAAGSCLAALRPLRSGDTARAIDSLELQLDGELVGLVCMRDSLRGEQAKMAAGILKHIRDYRAKYPYTTGDRTLDLPVQQALSTIESH